MCSSILKFQEHLFAAAEVAYLKKIMIIDDDVCIGDMLEELLAKENYSTVRAYSGTEALLYLSSHRPDLILLDLMLPGLSGEELLPLVRNIPVIVLSAKADINDKVELLMGGAADYITKPFHSAELLARIAVQLRETAAAAQREDSSILSFDAIPDCHRIWNARSPHKNRICHLKTSAP